MEEKYLKIMKIKFKDLSGWLKLAAIAGWVYSVAVIYIILTW